MTEEEMICIYCNEPIDMDDFRSYAIVQLQDMKVRIVYVHLNCLEMDEDHPIFTEILEGKT